MAARIRKGDKVVVLTGKDAGKQGEVLRVLTESNKVLVSGVNMIKRHTRASQAGPGGIQEREAAIHVSNVSHIDPKSNQPTRIGFKSLEDGRKVRYAKRSGEVIDV
jgi:large subunit ribosomal protein L24